jgi:hypothetical protein
MQEIYEMLHVMGDTITDQEFKNALMTSLLKSWDQFLTIYMQPGAAALNVTSYELHSILIEEDRHHKEGTDEDDDNNNKKKRKRESDKDDTALMVYPNKRKFADHIGPMKKCFVCKKPGHWEDQCWHKGKTCLNCKKSGHTKDDCWSPGGGKAGQGPFKGRKVPNRTFKAIANIATTSRITELPDDDAGDDDIAFMAQDMDVEFIDSKESDECLIWYDWVADSGTTTHITNTCAMMSDYTPITWSVSGIGNAPLKAIGRGTVELVNFIGKSKISFKLRDVLYVPDASHNLVSISRLDCEGGHASICNGELKLYSKNGAQFAHTKMEEWNVILPKAQSINGLVGEPVVS